MQISLTSRNPELNWLEFLKNDTLIARMLVIHYFKC